MGVQILLCGGRGGGTDRNRCSPALVGPLVPGVRGPGAGGGGEAQGSASPPCCFPDQEARAWRTVEAGGKEQIPRGRRRLCAGPHRPCLLPPPFWEAGVIAQGVLGACCARALADPLLVPPPPTTESAVLLSYSQGLGLLASRGHRVFRRWGGPFCWTL